MDAQWDDLLDGEQKLPIFKRKHRNVNQPIREPLDELDLRAIQAQKDLMSTKSISKATKSRRKKAMPSIPKGQLTDK